MSILCPCREALDATSTGLTEYESGDGCLIPYEDVRLPQSAGGYKHVPFYN